MFIQYHYMDYIPNDTYHDKVVLPWSQICPLIQQSCGHFYSALRCRACESSSKAWSCYYYTNRGRETAATHSNIVHVYGNGQRKENRVMQQIRTKRERCKFIINIHSPGDLTSYPQYHRALRVRFRFRFRFKMLYNSIYHYDT